MTATIRQAIQNVLLPLLVVLLCGPAIGQQKYPVRMKLEPLSIRGRSGGPVQVRVKLEYNAQQMMQGDLLLEIYNSVQDVNDLTATIRHEGIVLQGSDYIFDLTLPPFEHSYNKQYLIVGWFETASSRIPLSIDLKNPEEPTELLSIGPRQRATLVCSCSGESSFQRPSANRLYLNGALTLDDYNPIPPKDQSGMVRSDSLAVLDFAASWDAYDLPEDPLRFCSFDLVILADGALSRLEEAQMAGLTRWVEAGGSVCVFPDDNGLKTTHLNFLQNMFERPSEADLHLSLTDDGDLLVISNENNPIVNQHVGLGRATLLPKVDNIREVLKGPKLSDVVCHLWKARSDSAIPKDQRWDIPDARQLLEKRGFTVKRMQDGRYSVKREQPSPYGNNEALFDDLEAAALHHEMPYELHPRPGLLASACETELMPMDVELVPTWMIALLLTAYVITIGPVDYLVLGYFRARKYTWLLFPFVTAGFTMLTVVIAHEYMASSESGGRLSVTDVIGNGRPVRRTDLQMYFYSAQTNVKEDFKQTFVVPGSLVISTRPNAGQQGPRGLNSPLHYSGRLPQAFTTTQNLRQWTPRMTRSLTLNPDEAAVPKIPWDEIDLVRSSAGRVQLARMLSDLREDDRIVDAIVLHQRERIPLFGNGGFLFSNSKLEKGREWLNLEMRVRDYTPPPRGAILAMGILEGSAAIDNRDFFSIVTQVSPQGSATLEDLPVLDASDPNQWLLIVALQRGNQTEVFRRLFHDTDKQIQPKDVASAPAE